MSIFILLFSLFVLYGCGTKVKHYKQVDNCLDLRQYQKAPELIKEAREEGNYKKKDRVLYYLDLGIANHYGQNYKKSNENLEKAEQYMRELYTRSISKKGWSLLTNNNQLPYYGEEYENIYINVFKALNYVHMYKTSKAFVEIRDMYEKLDYMEQKYQKKVKKYKNQTLKNNYDKEVKKAIKEKKGDMEIKSDFSDSALGRYFNYAMYSSNKDWDDARISLENMKQAFAKQSDIYNFQFPKHMIKPEPQKTQKAVVHSIALLGRGPIKKEDTIRMPFPRVGYLKFVMPELIPRGTSITRVRLFREGKLLTELQPVEEVNRVAQAVFSMKKPLIVYKNLFRTVAKEVGGEVASEVAGEAMGGGAELAADIVGAIYTEVSEQADLRTTRLLPGTFRVASFFLPQGENHIQAKFYSNGRIVQKRKLCVNVSKETFNLIELITFK